MNIMNVHESSVAAGFWTMAETIVEPVNTIMRMSKKVIVCAKRVLLKNRLTVKKKAIITFPQRKKKYKTTP
jgi:hypothetical protein